MLTNNSEDGLAAQRLPAHCRLSNYVHPTHVTRTVRELAEGELPPLAAHLVTPWMGFAHHGIHVGDGKVVHYGALVYDVIRRPVEEVTLDSFAGGRRVFVVEHGDECLAPEDVIQRARSRLGENRYRLLTNNCEHFVEWCLHDAQRSFQVDTALAYARLMGERVQSSLLGYLQRLMTRTPVAVAKVTAKRDQELR
jgi:hypothetical protein